jgi:hypothetical protein
MSVDSEKAEEEFMNLTDDNQTEIEVEFGRLLHRYNEIYSQIDNLKSIVADDEGNISPHSFGTTDQEKFRQWREENEEAVRESPELVEEFEDIFSEVGIEIGEEVDLVDRDEMESVIGDELTEMFWNLILASAISRSEENPEQNQGILSNLRSKFGL